MKTIKSDGTETEGHTETETVDYFYTEDMKPLDIYLSIQ